MMAAEIDSTASQVWTPSEVNSFRVATVANRLALHVGTAPKDDVLEFFNLCLSLSRGIDYAVANNEVPSKAQELPNLLKMVCQRKTLLLQAAIMVLMVSVKSACKTGWFSNDDSRELLSLAEEVASNFSNIRDVNTEVSNPLQNIPTIVARFFPHFKMGQTLSFLEVKPGYGTYLTDFHIPKNSKPSGEEKVRLFVAQTDNMETSSCLISPPQANFLINGKGVEKRTNVSLESGPQLPTIVTHMLKFGTNILQVVGQFAGNYIIVVAYMSVISNHESSVLQDYAHSEVAVQDQDSELVEGPSRISLNCPISFKRIKIPVKGHLCKHIQCFDFDNFVDINSRRPSWRCPHCNQCVSYIDIRLDQYMAKVLKEVGEDVSEVIISADGSWKSATEALENSDPTPNMMPSCQKEMPAQPSNAPLDLMDLTDEGDADIDEDMIDIQDVKPILAGISNHFEVENATASPNIISQNGEANTEPDFWSQMFLSTYPPENSGPRSQIQLQSQISQFGNPLVGNEYGTNAPVTRPRAEVAIQALPAQPPTSVQQQSLPSHSSPSGPVSMGGGLGANYRTLERQIQNSRSHLSTLQSPQTNSSHFNLVHMSPMNSSPSSQFQSQNRHHQSNSFVSSPPAQPIISPPTLTTTSPRVSPHPIPPPHLRVPHIMSPSPNLNRSSSQSPRNNHSHISQQQMQSPQRPPHLAMARQHPAINLIPNQQNRATSSVPLAENGIRTSMGEQGSNMSNNSNNEENNWRPTSRMRGALQGQAYSAALHQFIFQPAQPVQATRPPTLPVPLPLNSLALLAANSRIALECASQGLSSPSTLPPAVIGPAPTVTEPTSAPR